MGPLTCGATSGSMGHRRKRGRGGGRGGEGKTGEAQATECGTLLKRLQVGLMQTPSFARLLARLTGMACTSSRGEARRFRAGLDYTVATYGSMASHARLNTVWCLVDDVDDDAPAGGDGGTWRAFSLGGALDYGDECTPPADAATAGGAKLWVLEGKPIAANRVKEKRGAWKKK